eukprot:jgi/Botrbrau1/15738/Bobra.4_1s0106.1
MRIIRSAISLIGFSTLLFALAFAEEPAVEKDREWTPEVLFNWIARYGGKANVTLQPNEDQIRGIFATQNHRKGDVIIKVPFKLAINLGDAAKGPPAHATQLLMHIAGYPEWNRFMEPYWMSLPSNGHSFSKFTMTPAHLSMLQSPELAEAARYVQAKTELEYTENALKQLPGLEDTVSMSYFKHLASVISTYTLSFPNLEDGYSTFMIPVMDLMNHAASHAANVMINMEDDNFVARALKDIKEGEELRQVYSDALGRNDHSLMHYGFIHRDNNPRMTCMDRLGGDLYDDTSCPLNDSDYAFGGALHTEGELRRLLHLHNNFPTTLGEDMRLLEDKTSNIDNIERVLVSFRVLRKRALQQVIIKLQQGLGVGSAASPEDEQ